jgi:hypothetical protein
MPPVRGAGAQAAPACDQHARPAAAPSRPLTSRRPPPRPAARPQRTPQPPASRPAQRSPPPPPLTRAEARQCPPGGTPRAPPSRLQGVSRGTTPRPPTPPTHHPPPSPGTPQRLRRDGASVQPGDEPQPAHGGAGGHGHRGGRRRLVFVGARSGRFVGPAAAAAAAPPQNLGPEAAAGGRRVGGAGCGCRWPQPRAVGCTQLRLLTPAAATAATALSLQFRNDYNQRHFVRNETFKAAAEGITGALPSRYTPSCPLAPAQLPTRLSSFALGSFGAPPLRPRPPLPTPPLPSPPCRRDPQDLHRVPGALLHGRVLRLPAVQGAGSPPEDHQPLRGWWVARGRGGQCGVCAWRGQPARRHCRCPA